MLTMQRGIGETEDICNMFKYSFLVMCFVIEKIWCVHFAREFMLTAQ